MSSKRTQLTRLLTRDRNVCGRHIGGCGKPIRAHRDASRDHMISQAFIRFMSAEQRTDFNRDWILQPMHRECNESRRGQFPGNWPLFECHCHYLQIAGGHMYIHDRLQAQARRHLLLKNAVSSEPGLMYLFAQRLPGDGSSVGYAKDESGHVLPAIPPGLVQPFNWFEQARVGIAKSGIASSGPNGEMAGYTPSGRVVSLSGHAVSPTYPVSQGHTLLNFDPFVRRSREGAP